MEKGERQERLLGNEHHPEGRGGGRGTRKSLDFPQSKEEEEKEDAHKFLAHSFVVVSLEEGKNLSCVVLPPAAEKERRRDL